MESAHISKTRGISGGMKGTNQATGTKREDPKMVPALQGIFETPSSEQKGAGLLLGPHVVSQPPDGTQSREC